MRTNPTSLPLSLAMCLAATLGFLGCEKNKSTTETPGNTEAGTGGEAESAGDDGGAAGDSGGSADVAWADMNRQQQLEYMGAVVLPRMKDAFAQQGFDSFKCANCHGANFKEVDFEMPNDLTPLNPTNPIQSGMDLDEETTKFMVSVVTPQMAEMLGMESDPTTGTTEGGKFGCLSCHLSE